MRSPTRPPARPSDDASAPVGGWRETTDSRAVALPAVVEAVFTGFLAERFPKAKGRRLSDEIAALSDAFTADREELPGSYLNRPESRSAYLAFFHPQQVLRAMSALSEVRARGMARGLIASGRGMPEVVRILDLGAGLGAMSEAALIVDAFPAQRHEVTLVDHQKSALTDAREILLRTSAALRAARAGAVESAGAAATASASEAAPRPASAEGATESAHRVPPTLLVRTSAERIEAWLRRADEAGWRFDVILLGGVWNEIRGAWQPLFERILGLLDAATPSGGIVVSMEPALPPFARRLADLRDSFLTRTTTIAPCTHDCQCPLTSLTKDWCFTVRPARLPAAVGAQASKLGHQSREVRYAFWAAAGRRSAAALELPAGFHGRVISDPVPGGQVVCIEGEKRRLPDHAPALRRGSLVAGES